MPPFKDEHILLIAPGSQTTLAQLGLPESFTPARLRIPTRMFPAETKGEWEPHKVRPKKRKIKQIHSGQESEAHLADADVKEDVAMLDAGEEPKAEPGHDSDTKATDPEQELDGKETDAGDGEDIYEEDLDSDEGAIYPLKEGRVTNWSCFLALLTHVYNTLSPPFHTPILLISQPAWTAQDRETLTQFFFEKFKTPAFCIMDSASAVCYAYGIPSATVVDIGFEKADVTAVSDFLVHDVGRSVAIPGCGGEAMTQQLVKLLEPRGFTYDMCEQLKRSNICEILPHGAPLPGSTNSDAKNISNPAAAASTGIGDSGSDEQQNGTARGPGPGTQVGEEDQDELREGVENEGVLDVASIVASGKTAEYLARKEKEKAERVKKGGAGNADVPAKPIRLPNSRKETNTFWYENLRARETNGTSENLEESEETNGEIEKQKTPEPAEVTETGEHNIAEYAQDHAGEGIDPSKQQQEKQARRDERRRLRQLQSDGAGPSRREVEVGAERFMATTGGIYDTLADAIHRTVLSVEEVNKRAELWESLIIVGNGSKVRGFKDGLISALTSKYLISPSSATIFTSELPSNLSTPVGTGTNTPQPQMFQGGPGGHVNPLLLAATTASNPSLHQQALGQHGMSTHSSHGQTPTSIKIAKIPEYFPEWKDAGFDEAVFLGAQVAAKVVFVVDQGLSKGFMSRVEYNEMGPQGIHESSL